MAPSGGESSRASAVDWRIPLYPKVDFVCEDGSSLQRPRGQSKRSLRKKCEMTVAAIAIVMAASAMIGFYFLGPLVNHTMVESEMTGRSHGQGKKHGQSLVGKFMGAENVALGTLDKFKSDESLRTRPLPEGQARVATKLVADNVGNHLLSPQELRSAKEVIDAATQLKSFRMSAKEAIAAATQLKKFRTEVAALEAKLYEGNETEVTTPSYTNAKIGFFILAGLMFGARLALVVFKKAKPLVDSPALTMPQPVALQEAACHKQRAPLKKISMKVIEKPPIPRDGSDSGEGEDDDADCEGLASIVEGGRWKPAEKTMGDGGVDFSRLKKAVLDFRREEYGPDNVHTLAALSDYAFNLSLKGADSEVDPGPLFKEAHEMSERMYGPEHPDTATALRRFIDFTQTTLQLRKSQLALTRQMLGSTHPDTLWSFTEYEETQKELNKLKQTRTAWRVHHQRKPEKPNTNL